uniref:BZIP domain-containing protein n=1 Tax=Strongyloides papillosus TaxID=174720 RepID=A0A0N5B8Y1_STREA
MSSLKKRKYSFVSENEKNSEEYKKRREANKAAVDKFRIKEKEAKDDQNKLLERKVQSLEEQIKQYDVNRQIDINLMKNEFTRQINELNNSWKSYFDQFASDMMYQQQQTNSQILQLLNNVNELSSFIHGQSSGHVMSNTYIGELSNQEDDIYLPSLGSVDSMFGKSSNYNLPNDITQVIPEYPFDDVSCVPLNATFTTEGEVNYNDPVQSDLILPGRPPPQVMERFENATDLDEISYVEDADIVSFILETFN